MGSIAAYGRPDFDPTALDPQIVAFYEHTADYELWVYPDWQPRFRGLAQFYKRISTYLEQMNLPLSPESDEMHISSTILPLKEAVDGRAGVRGWVRRYPATGQAIYVAAYADHQWEGETYMNIAFPLPFGNLASILHLEATQAGEGLLLSSFSTRWGDQGVYFATPWLSIRLPINETITVFPAGASLEGYPTTLPQGELVAQHCMWLAGLHCLTLYYSIRRR